LVERLDSVGDCAGGGERGDEDDGCDGQRKPVECYERGEEQDVGERQEDRDGGEGRQNEQVPITAS